MKKELILAFGLACSLFSCGEKTQSKHSSKKLVKTIEVSAANSSKTLAFPGKVKSGLEADLAFRISGPIAKIYVKEGQSVHQGQILAKMDDRDYQLQLSATKAEYNRIKSEVDRVVQLYKEESVTANEYDKAVFGLKQITAKLKAHENALNDVLLKAPFDGTIVGKALFTEGEIVGAGMPILHLSKGNDLVIDINIPAKEFLNRANFSAYYASFSLFPDKKFPLEELSIDRTANLNQLYNMRFSLKDKKDAAKELTAGMTTMVHICVKEGEQSHFLIPNNAIFSKEGNSFVWLVKGSEEELYLQAQPIHIEELFRNGTVRCTGLPSEARIVAAGVHTLQEGEAVRLLEKKSSTNVGGLL